MPRRLRTLTAPSADFWDAEGASTLRIDRDAEIHCALEHQGHALLIVSEPIHPSGAWREFRVSQHDPILADGEKWAGSWSYGQRLWHLVELPMKVEVIEDIRPHGEPDPVRSQPEPPPTPELIGMPKRPRGRPRKHPLPA